MCSTGRAKSNGVADPALVTKMLFRISRRLLEMSMRSPEDKCVTALCTNVSDAAGRGIVLSAATGLASACGFVSLPGFAWQQYCEKKLFAENRNILLCYPWKMNRKLKTFLLWLLICLVPLQGIAASLRASCGPDNQVTASASDATIHDVATVTSHHDSMTHRHAATSDAGLSTTDHGHAHQHKSAFCGTCGSCCIGAFAPPSKIDWELPISEVSIAIISPAPLVTGYFPNGLERPPRHTPA